MKKPIKILALSLLLILLIATLVSCARPAKNPETAKAALVTAGYEVDLINGDLLTVLDFEGLKTLIFAANPENERDNVTIYYFANAAAANAAFESIKEKAVEH